jgi:hypothetical protein
VSGRWCKGLDRNTYPSEFEIRTRGHRSNFINTVGPDERQDRSPRDLRLSGMHSNKSKKSIKASSTNDEQ